MIDPEHLHKLRAALARYKLFEEVIPEIPGLAELIEASESLLQEFPHTDTDEEAIAITIN